MPQGILALDIATVCGWAHIAPGMTKPQWGHFRLRGADGGAVAADFERRVKDLMIDSLRGDGCVVGWEAPYIPRGRMMNVAVTRRLFGLTEIAAKCAHQFGVAWREIEVTTVAKHFLNTGGLKRAEKKVATIRMCEMLGWFPCTEDEADALAVLSYLQTVLSPGAARLRGERLPLWAAI